MMCVFHDSFNMYVQGGREGGRKGGGIEGGRERDRGRNECLLFIDVT